MIPIPKLLVLHLLQFSWLQLNFVNYITCCRESLSLGEKLLQRKLSTFHQLLPWRPGRGSWLVLYSHLVANLFHYMAHFGPLSCTTSANPPHHDHCCLLQIQPKHFFLHNTQFGCFIDKKHFQFSSLFLCKFYPCKNTTLPATPQWYFSEILL